MKHDYIETHIANHEYIEGPQATENFNRVATAVFQSDSGLFQNAIWSVGDTLSGRLSGLKLFPTGK